MWRRWFLHRSKPDLNLPYFDCHNGVSAAQSSNIHLLRKIFKPKQRIYSMPPEFSQLPPAEQQNFGNGIGPGWIAK
tara:strand:- start:221 stop:448 length:228 start_codon:yes stop_codon:yes gene_type:complete